MRWTRHDTIALAVVVTMLAIVVTLGVVATIWWQQ